MTDSRAQHEIAHGRRLASADPERIWGWASPAGHERAARRARLIGEAADLGPGRRAIEIGCGTGAFTEVFARTGAHITAVEISEPLAEQARQRLRDYDNVDLLVTQFEDASIEQRFDAVIGSSVLHHLDVDRALDRIRTLLHPGGVLALAEPNLLNPQVFVERRFRRLFPSVSPDETAFVRRRLSALLQAKGFSDVTITPFDFLHPEVPAWAISAVSRLGRVLESTPLLRELAGSLLIRACLGLNT